MKRIQETFCVLPGRANVPKLHQAWKRRWWKRNSNIEGIKSSFYQIRRYWRWCMQTGDFLHNNCLWLRTCFWNVLGIKVWLLREISRGEVSHLVGTIGFVASSPGFKSHCKGNRKTNRVGRFGIKWISVPVVPHIIMYQVVVGAIHDIQRMSAINVQTH